MITTMVDVDTCPACGRQIRQNHRCAGDGRGLHPMPGGFREVVAAEVAAAQAPAQGALPLGEDEHTAVGHACTTCGTESAVLIGPDMVCRRCLFAGVKAPDSG